ncbi:hypothetical protein C7M84_013096 [Penaeus vannamei]|uniref:Uncharacterized protein n=1 Tax=Penaeus vannamei TaxID=6689 RepID=A0A3R7LZF2_PENVA|nr:hypothetical protein C7M84_013096 [Penaeus vannamei]
MTSLETSHRVHSLFHPATLPLCHPSSFFSVTLLPLPCLHLLPFASLASLGACLVLPFAPSFCLPLPSAPRPSNYFPPVSPALSCPQHSTPFMSLVLCPPTPQSTFLFALSSPLPSVSPPPVPPRPLLYVLCFLGLPFALPPCFYPLPPPCPLPFLLPALRFPSLLPLPSVPLPLSLPATLPLPPWPSPTFRSHILYPCLSVFSPLSTPPMVSLPQLLLPRALPSPCSPSPFPSTLTPPCPLFSLTPIPPFPLLFYPLFLPFPLLPLAPLPSYPHSLPFIHPPPPSPPSSSPPLPPTLILPPLPSSPLPPPLPSPPPPLLPLYPLPLLAPSPSPPTPYPLPLLAPSLPACPLPPASRRRSRSTTSVIATAGHVFCTSAAVWCGCNYHSAGVGYYLPVMDRSE